jgi:hypothetical protein
MNNFVVKILGLAILAMILKACDKNDDGVWVDPIIGDWSISHENGFITLQLDEEEISISDFGMTVFGLNEESAAEYVQVYLQAQVLGPIDVNAPAISFKEGNVLRSQKAGEYFQGHWQWMNDRQYLRLGAESLPLDYYNFTVDKLTASQLILRFDATIEIIYETENEVYPYSVLIHLKK